MSDPHSNRRRAVTNTIVCTIFLAMSVAVMLTRVTWWATILMAVISIWALFAVIANAIAIKKGLPPLKEVLPQAEKE